MLHFNSCKNGQKFFILLNQYYFSTEIFWILKCFICEPKIFWSKNILGQKNSFGPKLYSYFFFWHSNSFFGQHIFFYQKIFLCHFSGLNFFPQFFLTLPRRRLLKPQLRNQWWTELRPHVAIHKLLMYKKRSDAKIWTPILEIEWDFDISKLGEIGFHAT